MARMLEDSWVGTELACTHSDLRTRGLDHSCGTPALAWPDLAVWPRLRRQGQPPLPLLGRDKGAGQG